MTTRYLPSLDGWRAVAILSVILYHSTLLKVGFFTTSWFWHYGNRGVDVFFAISGLLITSKLLDEEKATSTISLRTFYMRRAFRILPPALLFLFTIALLAGAGMIPVSGREIFSALFFSRNYSRIFHLDQLLHPPWFTNHFWSLSIEEHFYLLLPALLLFTRGKTRIAALTAISACVIVHRYLVLTHRAWLPVQFHTDIRLDGLMIPALFAVLSNSAVYGKSFNAFIRRWHLVFLLGFLIFVQWPEKSALQATAIALVLPGIVLGTVLQPKSLWTQILEWRPLRWIGRISYSLYLWQQLFFTDRFLGTRPLGRIEGWPLNLGLTFLVAALSYYGVERPLVRLGHRLTRGRPKSVVAIEAVQTAG
jgi:peptidoglycan/LPS O-acetylase OafA/YrhL